MIRDNRVLSEIQRKILMAILSLIIVLSIGTTGYWLIGGREYSVVDCLYMTILTISTIGFTEGNYKDGLTSLSDFCIILP